MRDPERIDRILEQLRFVWRRYPQLRLGQILLNAVDSYDLYNMEDEDLFRHIEDTYFIIRKEDD